MTDLPSRVRVRAALISGVFFAPVAAQAAVATLEDVTNLEARASQLTRAERAAGWHWLFDGVSTSALRGYRKAEFPRRGWVVEDGALRHVQGGGGGDVISRRAYRNFDLRLEWKVGKGANSGILYKVGEGDGPSYHTGLEYQVLDDAAHKRAQGKSIGAGGLYGLYTPRNKQLFATGMWNRTRIVVRGDHVEHWLNGAKILECSVGSEDWKARVAASKFKKWKRFGTVVRGHIALQDHGNDVWYRRVRIRELPPERARCREALRLFDGRSLAAWEEHAGDGANGANSATTWSIDKDGRLVCRGVPRGYLKTRRAFESFILDLDWRWPEGKAPGNSGVLLRAQGDAKPWPRSIEAQLQSGRAGDFWNIGGMVMKTDASRRRGRNTVVSHGNEAPIGSWNHYRIICDGSWLRLIINGEVVNEAWGADVIAGPICLQSEGSELHFARITLTPLRK